MRPPRPPSGYSVLNRLTHKSLHPYAKSIGEVAIAWNNLQEELSCLFSVVVAKEATGDMGMSLTIWHSIDSDRAQRKMLLQAASRIKWFRYISDEGYEAINWLKIEADKLSDLRNDIVHSPMESSTFIGTDTEITSVQPAGLFHPRARKLKAKKDILSEIRWCRNVALVLAQYSRQLTISVREAQRAEFPGEPTLMTLPDRPKLPNRGQKIRYRSKRSNH